MIDNKVLGYEDFPIDDYAQLTKNIINVVDGIVVVSVVGILSRT